MSAASQHYLNPLHVYCRLRDMGIRKEAARWICKVYEITLYTLLFR